MEVDNDTSVTQHSTTSPTPHGDADPKLKPANPTLVNNIGKTLRCCHNRLPSLSKNTSTTRSEVIWPTFESVFSKATFERKLYNVLTSSVI